MIGVINPGTGPVAGNPAQAWKNIHAFIADLNMSRVRVRMIRGADGGRYAFELRRGIRKVRIDMPGVALAKVRVLAGQRYNPFETPRLYVDGSSWYWHFAVSQTWEEFAGGAEAPAPAAGSGES